MGAAGVTVPSLGDGEPRHQFLDCPFVLFVQVNRTGHIQRANEEFSRLVGISEKDLKSKMLAKTIGLATLRGTFVETAFLLGLPIQSSGFSAGLMAHTHMIAVPMKEGASTQSVQIFGLMAAPRPTLFTEPVDAETKATDANEGLKRLIAILAHDINNALSTVQVTAQLLGTITPDEQDLARLSRRIETAAQYAMVVLNDLKLIGSPVKRHQDIDMNELLQSLAEMMASQTEAAGAEIVLRLQDDLPLVRGDQVRMKQVFINLIKNALESIGQRRYHDAISLGKFSAAKCQRHIVVKTSYSEDGTVRISVFDRGVPVPPEWQGRLFEPFFSSKTEGIGLGLLGCRDIVEAHHGTLEYRSSPLLGTLFRVRVPAMTASNPLGTADNAGRFP